MQPWLSQCCNDVVILLHTAMTETSFEKKITIQVYIFQTCVISTEKEKNVSIILP